MQCFRKYDDSNLQQRAVQNRHKAANFKNQHQQQQQQQQQQQHSRMDNAGMQNKPRQQQQHDMGHMEQQQHDMGHMEQQQQQHREPPPPITKGQPRDSQREPQRDNWYRDDWFSRQDNNWDQGTHQRTDQRYGQYPGDYRNRRRSPSPERGWEVDLGGGGGYYR